MLSECKKNSELKSEKDVHQTLVTNLFNLVKYIDRCSDFDRISLTYKSLSEDDTQTMFSFFKLVKEDFLQNLYFWDDQIENLKYEKLSYRRQMYPRLVKSKNDVRFRFLEQLEGLCNLFSYANYPKSLDCSIKLFLYYLRMEYQDLDIYKDAKRDCFRDLFSIAIDLGHLPILRTLSNYSPFEKETYFGAFEMEEEYPEILQFLIIFDTNPDVDKWDENHLDELRREDPYYPHDQDE